MPSYDNEFDEEYDEEDDFSDEEEGAVLACEDCDYRWRVDPDQEVYEPDEGPVCPMCGSDNIVEI
ncbi:MAG: hypothetical protein SFU98_08955 [Leptospiraceae bacterium]|nr:hypothetical protein [Leptospiraceae bacterium]